MSRTFADTSFMMTEGWHNQDYLILFDEESIADVSRRYGIGTYMAGHEIVGLRGWDDFIVRDNLGSLFTVPTVPLDAEYLEPLGCSIDQRQIQRDERFLGKIKWYVHPIVFGGDPACEDNMTWVGLEEHIELVRWWNRKYKEVAGS
jgi:hypothetical protein